VRTVVRHAQVVQAVVAAFGRRASVEVGELGRRGRPVVDDGVMRVRVGDGASRVGDGASRAGARGTDLVRRAAGPHDGDRPPGSSGRGGAEATGGRRGGVGEAVRETRVVERARLTSTSTRTPPTKQRVRSSGCVDLVSA